MFAPAHLSVLFITLASLASSPPSAVGQEYAAVPATAADSDERPPAPIFLPPVDDDQHELTLAAAERLATANHPALREAAAQVRAAQGKWVQVGLRPNPTLGYAGEEIGSGGTAGKQGGFIGQEFVTAGKLDLNRSVAMREQQAAEQRLERTRLQIITTVRKYYFEALVAERAVVLARQLGAIASQSVDVSQKRLKALEVPRTTLLQSQIESESAALAEEQAVERRDAAWRRLTSVIGKPHEGPTGLEDVLSRPLPELEFAVVRERLLRDSPELSELRFAVDRARAAIERANAGRVPNVTVQGGVQHDYEVQDTIANVEVSVPIPVFDRNQGAVAQACGELAAAQAALEARQLALDEQLASSIRDYRTARERVMRYSGKVLPAAKETLDLISNGYQQGQLEYLQVLTVQQTYAAKNLSYLQDLEIAWKQWAEIDGLLVGDLGQSSIDRFGISSENANEARASAERERER